MIGVVFRAKKVVMCAMLFTLCLCSAQQRRGEENVGNDIIEFLKRPFISNVGALRAQAWLPGWRSNSHELNHARRMLYLSVPKP